MRNRKMMSMLACGALCTALMMTAGCKEEGALQTTAEQTQQETTAEEPQETTAEEAQETTEEQEETSVEAVEEATKEAVSDAADTGWNTDEKGTYFLIEGERQTGVVNLTEYLDDADDGLMSAVELLYAFDEDGYMYTSQWVEVGEDRYYARESGQLCVSASEIDGVFYAFNGDGKLTTGLRMTLDPNDYGVYYYEKTGRVINGWKTLGERTLYFGEDGKAVSGWQIIDDKKYYFGKEVSDVLADYLLVTGEATIDGEKYEFDEDGVLKD